MKKENRKQFFLLISNGGFMESLEEGWDSLKKDFENFNLKDTVDKIFGDSKKKEDLEKNAPESLKQEIQSEEFKTNPEKRKKILKEMESLSKKSPTKKSTSLKKENPLKGYKRATSPLPSNANEECKKLLHLPKGSMKSIQLNDGKWYIAVVEEHFDNHPRAWGDPYKHKGVSLFQPIEGSGKYRGEIVA